MLQPRIIPVLTIRNKGLVKTERFGRDRYVGDPLNAVKIFNEKKADEIMVVDIDATVQGESPNFNLVRKLAYECKMPMGFGGGVKNYDQALRILGLGVEKVVVSSLFFEDRRQIELIARSAGSQSVTVVFDVRRSLLGQYTVVIHNGGKRVSNDLPKCIREAIDLGAGEIVINSVDRDGRMIGYDLGLHNMIVSDNHVPTVFLGGAGKYDHIRGLFAAGGMTAAACGSLFVFNGKYKAVLINYPSEEEKQKLFQEA